MNRITFAIALAVASLSTAAIAQTQDEQQACMNDAFRVCSATIPGSRPHHRLHDPEQGQLSSACQMVMAKYAPAGTRPDRSSRGRDPHTPVMSRPAKPIRTATNTGRPGKPLNILMR